MTIVPDIAVGDGTAAVMDKIEQIGDGLRGVGYMSALADWADAIGRLNALIPLVDSSLQPLAMGQRGAVARARINALNAARWWRADAYRIAALDGGDLDAGLTADFRRGRYALPDMTPAQILAATPAEIAAAMRACSFADVFEFTRLSSATGNTSGQLTAFTAGQPRLTDDGFLLEGPATNKVTARKHNPVDTANLSKGGAAAATLTVVDDAAALATAGLAAICANGKVYRLDNSGGLSSAWVLIGGATGNTAAHALSAYVRGGSGNIQFSGGVGGSIALASSAAYRRVSASLTPADATRSFAILANPGQIIHVILPQLEEGALATSVIPGDTPSAVSRAADNARLTARAAALLQRASAGLLVQGRSIWGGSGRLLGTAGDGSKRVLGLSPAGDLIVLGNSNFITLASSLPVPTPSFGMAAGWNGAGKAGSYNGGGVASNTVALDSNLSEIYLGRTTAGDYASGYYHQLAAWPARPANAALAGKATPYV